MSGRRAPRPLPFASVSPRIIGLKSPRPTPTGRKYEINKKITRPRARDLSEPATTMNTGTEDRDKRPGADAGAKGGDLATNALLQQQLQQQQLQLLQLQQQQLASMSPSEIAAMTQQMALFMMPMMPFMMPLNQQLVAGAGSTDAPAAAASSSASTTATSTSASAASAFTSSDAMGLGAAAGDAFSSQSSPLSLLGGAQFGNLTPSTEEAPKRKRGRPPKKDVAARAKADAEKTIKQFPMWGYGLPMPLLPGFPGVLPGVAGAAKDETGGAQTVPEEQKDGVIDEGLNASATEAGKPPKKKSRGTGKPRGRPRTRPRPGEIIHRAKPPAIAPANYSVMYNYSLSNMAQKSAELGGEVGGAGSASAASTHDDNRLASLGASLLSGDHE